MTWILFTLLAALMQAVRTAGQKSLAVRTSPLAATWTRYAFGLPFAILYLAAVWTSQGSPQFAIGRTFWIYSALASLAQVVATLLLVHVLAMRNFAAATTYAKTEAVLTALLGTAFFGSRLSAAAWVSVLVGVGGTFLVSVRQTRLSLRDMFNRSLLYGLGAGLGFALTSWWLRTASLSLSTDFLLSAAFTLAAMGIMQTALCSVLLVWREPTLLRSVRAAWPLCLFVGITSVAGSIGWFTAMTIVDAAYVKALGQIEFVFTIALTHWLFREKISRYEWLGLVMVATAVMALLLGDDLLQGG